MDLIQAISTRYSCRAYERKLLDSETFDSLDAYIRELNDASGLRFQLYGPREGSTSAIDMSDAMFTGSVPCGLAAPKMISSAAAVFALLPAAVSVLLPVGSWSRPAPM